MATFADTAAPRKRVATYGKAGRRRIPNYSFASLARKSQTPDLGESEPLSSESPSTAPVGSEKLRRVARRSTSGSPPSTSPVGANVFDVPSSDEEEALPIPRSVHKSAPKPPKKTKITSPKKTLPVTTGNDERRKKMKFSPAYPPSERPLPAKAPTKQPMMSATKQASKQLHKSLGMGQTSTLAARLKPPALRRKPEPEAPRAPPKSSTPPSKITPSTPSPARSDPDGMDADPPATYISPKGLQMWKELLEPVENDGVTGFTLEAEDEGADATEAGPSTTLVSIKTLSKPAGVSKSSRKSPEKLRRRRLIDSLVEQTIQQSDNDEDMLDSDESDSVPSLALPLGLPGTTDIPSSQGLAPELPGSTALSTSQGSQNVGLKFTYSRQRSMLAEQDLMQELALDMPSQPAQAPNGRRPRRGSIPTLQPLQSFHEEEEDDEGAVGIRSVHELRQAGANNRFMDEIEDFLDRIGTPSTPASSMRRSGLLELASKMKDKDFVRKFRANGVEQRLFVHLGQETDLIAGFVMVSILIAVLVDTSMPHVVAQLRRHGITRLLIRLLECERGIVPLSKDRKSNMSKIAQSSISEHQEFLLKLPVWEELQPRITTPRTTALKCLELMIRQTREAGNSGDIISKELTTNLFSILKSASEESSWELPNGQQAIDFCLALSALESHSIAARTAHDESIWIGDYLPVIADTLETALSRPADEFGLLQVLILRLTLNVTNNNPKASDVFAREALMAVMGQAIVTKFRMISRFLTEEEFSIAMDHLILVLGVMINFAEWSSLARASLQILRGKDNDPLGDMIQLFVENQARTSEAESVEESQKNVAFGYLSVLLGYLSLSPDIAERIRVQQPQRTIRPLVSSIEEFIGHHKTVDDLIGTDEDGHSARTGLTERLESLVAKLKEIKLAGKK